MTNFRSFGYVRHRRPSDLYRRLFGYPNLMKRLQARDIMAALDLNPSDRVLDVGCAYGMFTVEMARIASEAVGIDISPPGASESIPPELAGRLRFITHDARDLPLPDAYFDVVLASEVLMMIPDPAEFLVEIRRVLKPGGRLVVVNGIGYPAIERAYREKQWKLRLCRFLWPKRFPPTYEAFVNAFKEFHRTAFEFRSREWYRELLTMNGYRIVSEIASPTDGATVPVSWDIFMLMVRTGRANPFWFFEIKYSLFGLFGRLNQARTLGGQLIVLTTDDL